MTRGLLQKGLYEVWVVTVLCAVGVLVFEAIFAYVTWLQQQEMAEYVQNVDFARRFLERVIGADPAAALDPNTFAAFAWVHPTVLSLLWAHVITVCTRVPAGEIDRGTADLLLALPLTRRHIFLAETLTWIIAIGVVLIAMAAGNFIGNLFVPAESRPELHQIAIVLANLGCLVAFIAGLSFLTSAASDRRGRAVGVAVTLLVVWFLLNFLDQFWEPLQALRPLNPLSYFKPLPILSEGEIPWRDMAVLSVTGIALWVAAGMVFARRDIRTV